MLRQLRVLPLLALPLIAPACADSPDVDPPVDPSSPLASGDDFVAIPRHVEPATTTARRARLTELGAPIDRQRAAGAGDFYLAIRKDALDDKYFLSAFIEQYFPGAVAGGAANSLGTRVVSFEVQNDKLFVFDVDDRADGSEVFDPQRIVEAYPLVRDRAITGIPGGSQYVFIDPAAGLNRFDFLSDAFAWTWTQVRFETELSFLQNFVRLDDGVSFEQVFTGYAETPIGDGTIEPNVFRASGTLSFALRRYQEGPGYREVALPSQEHYFRSDPPRLVENTGALEQVAAHWDLHPGMAPIEWVISPQLAALDDTPAYADIDLIDTVSNAITGWNGALGFEAFTARVAAPDESFARDDLNYIIFDPDPSLGYAFANWRTNPNTGEIRGASVYFGAGWIDPANFPDDVEAPADGELIAPPAPAEHPKVATLRWGGTANAPLCVLWAHDHGARLGGGDGDAQLTGAEKLERYLGQMIAHEIGHDLGLRHNFKGSLVPPTSSVMEYSNFGDRVLNGGSLGSYDVAAIQYLYGLSDQLPADPFCTDDHVGTDPDCRTFDTGANPLDDLWAADVRFIRDYFTTYGLGEEDAWYIDYYAAEVIDYAQTGAPEQADRALNVLFEGVAAPIDPALVASTPSYAAGADLVLRQVLLAVGPSPSPVIAARVDDQLGQVMRNSDGVRSLTTRRLLVDILKSRQSLTAYRALLDARAQVDAELEAGLSPDDELRARDLQLRIDRATTPYFD